MCHPDSIPEQQEQEIVCPTSKFGSSSSSTSSSSLSSSSAKNSNRIAKVREWSQILQYLPTPDNELSQEGYSAAASATATAISANDIDQAYARMEAIHAELHAFLESDGNEQEGSLPLDSDQILALTSEFRACYRTFLQGNNAELDAFAASDISAKAELSSGKEEEGQAEPAFIPYQVDPELLRRVEERLAAATKPVAIITRTTRNSVDFVLPYKENPDYANSNSISGNAGAMPIPDYANAKIIHSQYIHVTTRWLDPQYQNQNQNQHQQQQQQQETTDVLLMVTSTTPSGTTTRTIVRGGNAVSTTTTNNADININISSSSSTNSSTDVISSDLFAQYLFGGYRCAITRQQQQLATTATTATTVTTATTKDNGGTTTTRRKARRKSARLRVVPLHKKKRNNSNNNNNNRTSCASDNKNNSNNDDDDDSNSNSNSSKKKPRTEDSHNNNNININEEQEQEQEQQEQHGGK